MSQYILILIWIGVLCFLSSTRNVYQSEYVCGKKETRVTMGFAILAVIPLIWWATNRPLYFQDTGAYMNMFNELPTSIFEIPAYIANANKDKGFFLLSILIKCIVGQNYKVYFFILAAVQAIIIAFVFRKYSSNFIFSLFLFIATTDYISWMHNGIRQFTAVALIFAATEYMLKRRYLPLIGIILLASTIHGSALLMLPIVFVVQGKPWNRKTFLAILVFMAAIIYVDRFTNLLDALLVDTQYTNVVSDWQTYNDNGTNPIRVLVYAVPTVLSFIGIRFIRAERDPVINLACNMGIISTMLYCLSMVTSGIHMGRLPVYCSLYAMEILLPWELDNMFTEESAKLLKLGAVICFLGFYLYQLRFAWGLI